MTNEVVTLQGSSLTANPFGSSAPAAAPAAGMGNAMMTAETQRAIAEIQAASIMALHNPRNPQVAVDRILNECQRPTLAEVAIYSFPRGGQNVTGPSIRLAEVIKRHWQHIRSGWRCLERSKGRSLIEAYAYDIQNNVGENRTFEVHHVRDTRQGRKPLTDERDIYELEANQAARRVRACILALIDGDVIEAALDQCTRTLEAKADTTPEGIKRMLEAFKPHKVNQAMIEARIGRNLSAITAAQMVALKNILNGMKDGMSTREHWFDIALFAAGADDKEPQGSEEKKSSAANAALKDKIKASPVTAKANDEASASANALANAIANAKNVDELDKIWNESEQVLDTIKQSSKEAFDKLDQQYLAQHDALSNKTNTSAKTLV